MVFELRPLKVTISTVQIVGYCIFWLLQQSVIICTSRLFGSGSDWSLLSEVDMKQCTVSTSVCHWRTLPVQQ